MLGFTEGIWQLPTPHPPTVRHDPACGPTGSGKSMTLYSALNEINASDIVIRTAEDPIEYTLSGINQMQMHRQIGLTFATALRSFFAAGPGCDSCGRNSRPGDGRDRGRSRLTGHCC